MPKAKKTDKQRIYILDTNIFMADPDCMNRFGKHMIVVPDMVIEELDDNKKASGDKGYNTRQSLRNFDSLRRKGNLIKGVPTESGGSIRITSDYDHVILPSGWKDKPDNRILQVAKGMKEESEQPVILVSKDTNVRIKADILKVKAEDYKHEMIDEDHLRYNGRNEILLTDKDFQKLLQGTPIELKKAKFERCNKDRELLENEFLYITNQTTYGTLLAKVRENFIISLQYDSIRPFGVQPRNVGQRFAIEALLAPANELPLVILKGSAGTAKTFLTLACALQQCAEENIYRKITIADCLRNGDYNENEQDYIRTDQKITGSQCIYPTRQCLFTDTGIYRSLFDPCFHCFQTSCPYFTKAWL